MKLAEILSGPETWCQGWFVRGSSVCLVGALQKMFTGDPEDDSLLPSREVMRLGKAMRLVDRTAGHIPTWNDDPKRSWEEVAAVVEAYDRDRLLNP